MTQPAAAQAQGLKRKRATNTEKRSIKHWVCGCFGYSGPPSASEPEAVYTRDLAVPKSQLSPSSKAQSAPLRQPDIQPIEDAHIPVAALNSPLNDSHSNLSSPATQSPNRGLPMRNPIVQSVVDQHEEPAAQQQQQSSGAEYNSRPSTPVRIRQIPVYDEMAYEMDDATLIPLRPAPVLAYGEELRQLSGAQPGHDGPVSVSMQDIHAAPSEALSFPASQHFDEDESAPMEDVSMAPMYGSTVGAQSLAAESMSVATESVPMVPMVPGVAEPARSLPRAASGEEAVAITGFKQPAQPLLRHGRSRSRLLHEDSPARIVSAVLNSREMYSMEEVAVMQSDTHQFSSHDIEDHLGDTSSDEDDAPMLQGSVLSSYQRMQPEILRSHRDPIGATAQQQDPAWITLQSLDEPLSALLDSHQSLTTPSINSTHNKSRFRSRQSMSSFTRTASNASMVSSRPASLLSTTELIDWESHVVPKTRKWSIFSSCPDLGISLNLPKQSKARSMLKTYL